MNKKFLGKGGGEPLFCAKKWFPAPLPKKLHYVRAATSGSRHMLGIFGERGPGRDPCCKKALSPAGLSIQNETR
jgi:hypothetical protein